MWMMGYNDTAGDSFSGRKLRTLMPRPAPTTPINPPCLGRIHGTDLLSFNHHHLVTHEQSKRDYHAQQVVVSSRWNPTPEQLQTLEELYRRGTRTPSADQIQHITAQLRKYGKIEGKNVFYWFQNHKARERQKRRRQLESSSDHQQQPHNNMENPERKESGANGTGLEVERTKNWASPTNCSTTLAEKTVSMQRAARAEEWVQFDDAAELQQRKSLEERNATWQMMQFFGSSSPTTNIPTLRRSPSSKQLMTKKPHNLNIFLTPYEEGNLVNLDDDNSTYSTHDDDGSNTESQTLQLFPLQSSQENPENNIGGDHKEDAAEMIISVSEMNTLTTTSTSSTPQKFFEFLPLKN